MFIGRTDAEAETAILWPPDVKGWLIWEDPDAGKDWGHEEKRTTEDEMVGWHHRLNGHGFGWTLGDGDGQGGLACCGSWGRKESDMTERLNWLPLKCRGCFPFFFIDLSSLCMCTWYVYVCLISASSGDHIAFPYEGKGGLPLHMWCRSCVSAGCPYSMLHHILS